VSSWHWQSAIVAVLLAIGMTVSLGSPTTADADQPTSFAYVAGVTDVSVLNTSTDAVGEVSADLWDALAVATTPDGAFAYVAGGNEGLVSVIDTSTNTVIADISVPGYPWGVAVTPNGAFAYVANDNGTVAVINTATNTVVATVPVGISAKGVAVTPNGAFVYATDPEGGSVSIISTATNSVVATLSGLTGDPFDVAITPNGAFVYVTLMRSGNVLVIETSTNKVVATIPVGSDPWGVAVTPDGAFAYVANGGSKSVSVIDTATNSVVATIGVGNSPYGVAITPNSAFAYVTNSIDGTVSVIATSTNTVVATVPMRGELYELAITPPIMGPEAPTTTPAAPTTPTTPSGSHEQQGTTAPPEETLTSLGVLQAPSVDIAKTPRAVEKVVLVCTGQPLVLSDVLIRGSRVQLAGSADRSLRGKTIRIVFDGARVVATAKVDTNGLFATTAPLPPADILDTNTARYMAEYGRQRSLNLKLTRRLILEPPKVAGRGVTLSGQVLPPLTTPTATIAVQQELKCGRNRVVGYARPGTTGRFRITFTAPRAAHAGIYRLSSSVLSVAGSTQQFATYSLPLPAVF
jgi:YVTN family beta-propeller protein